MTPDFGDKQTLQNLVNTTHDLTSYLAQYCARVIHRDIEPNL